MLTYHFDAFILKHLLILWRILCIWSMTRVFGIFFLATCGGGVGFSELTNTGQVVAFINMLKSFPYNYFHPLLYCNKNENYWGNITVVCYAIVHGPPIVSSYEIGAASLSVCFLLDLIMITLITINFLYINPFLPEVRNCLNFMFIFF